MKILGITGGVGSGKSKVLHFLEDEYGAVVCQLDEVDVLITDSRIPQDELEEIKKVVETVIIAR